MEKESEIRDILRQNTFRATENVDVEAFDEAVNRGFDSFHKDRWGRTPLHKAVDQGNLQTVMNLIRIQSYVDAGDRFDCTALHLAAKKGHSDIVTCLIESGAFINARDSLDRTPLHLAASQEIGEILAENGADLNAEDFNLWRPLHYAVLENNVGLISFLLERGAKADAIDLDGNTPCHVAADYGRLDLVEILLPVMKENLCNGLKQTVYDLILKTHPDWKDLERKFPVLRQCPVLLETLPESKDYLLDLDRDHYSLGQTKAEKDAENFTKPAESLEIISELAQANPAKKEKYLRELLQKFALPPIHWISDGHPGCEVAVRVLEFVNYFLKKVAEIDSRFAGTVERIGSSADGSKLGDPDEFDFLFLIQDLVNAEFEFDDSRPGRVQVRLTDGEIQKRWKSLLNANNELHERHVNSHFGQLLWETSRRLKFLTNFGFSFRKVVRLDKFQLNYPKHAAPLVCTNRAGFTLRLNCLITGLRVDVDVIPGIKIQGWPKKHAIPLEHLRQVFPASVKDEDINYCIVPKTAQNRWEVTFVSTEKTVLSNCGESLKDALRVLKILNFPTEQALVASRDGTYGQLMDSWPSSYVMKTGFLRYLAFVGKDSAENRPLLENVNKILQILRQEIDDNKSGIKSFFVPQYDALSEVNIKSFNQVLYQLIFALSDDHRYFSPWKIPFLSE